MKFPMLRLRQVSSLGFVVLALLESTGAAQAFPKYQPQLDQQGRQRHYASRASPSATTIRNNKRKLNVFDGKRMGMMKGAGLSATASPTPVISSAPTTNSTESPAPTPLPTVYMGKGYGKGKGKGSSTPYYSGKGSGKSTKMPYKGSEGPPSTASFQSFPSAPAAAPSAVTDGSTRGVNETDDGGVAMDQTAASVDEGDGKDRRGAIIFLYIVIGIASSVVLCICCCCCAGFFKKRDDENEEDPVKATASIASEDDTYVMEGAATAQTGASDMSEVTSTSAMPSPSKSLGIASRGYMVLPFLSSKLRTSKVGKDDEDDDDEDEDYDEGEEEVEEEIEDSPKMMMPSLFSSPPPPDSDDPEAFEQPEPVFRSFDGGEVDDHSCPTITVMNKSRSASFDGEGVPPSPTSSLDNPSDACGTEDEDSAPFSPTSSTATRSLAFPSPPNSEVSTDHRRSTAVLLGTDSEEIHYDDEDENDDTNGYTFPAGNLPEPRASNTEEKMDSLLTMPVPENRGIQPSRSFESYHRYRDGLLSSLKSRTQSWDDTYEEDGDDEPNGGHEIS